MIHSVDKHNVKHVTIHPGEYYVSNQDVVISTLLGSCISACVYDPVTRIVGMNHFLLSNKRYSRDMKVCLTEAGRYGIHAMELVINDMLKLGAKRKNLRAKVFGGSSLLGQHCGRSDNFPCVGEVNRRFILEFLSDDGIPLVASSLGGERGRVIRFSSIDYTVRMRLIGRSHAAVLAKTDKKVWLKEIKSHDKKTIEPEIWG